MTPDRGIVRQLQQIEKTLTVVWDTGNERWAIYHDLPPDLGRLDELVAKMSRELRLTYLEAGHVIDPEQAGRLCLQAVKNAALVCYVTEDNGDYRPLDGRIVDKFRRMDSLRRNCGVKDWTELLAARRYAAEQAELLGREDFWEYQSRDAVLQRVLSDVLWGVPVARSVYLKRPEDEEIPEEMPPDDDDENGDEEAKHLPPTDEEAASEGTEKGPGLTTDPPS
jgi:hypothetical protein